jgi:hypothetical protein
MKNIVLCSDLDRTILPNGTQPQSPKALRILHTLAEMEEITLAYVSGRSESLLKEAIEEYGIPVPDYAIGDVGTTIYNPAQDWRPWDDWAREIASDWQGKTRNDLEKMFADITILELQEPGKQNTFKLSYYTDTMIDINMLKKEMEKRLAMVHVDAGIIWSIDEEKNVGLLDILPKRATKVHAIRFLMKKLGYPEEQTVFAGDSGNDLPVLTSGLKAVLVKNAMEEVRQEVIQAMVAKGLEERIYFAKGDFLGMNGNYCAGVLEGVAHFFPETRSWMDNFS